VEGDGVDRGGAAAETPGGREQAGADGADPDGCAEQAGDYTAACPVFRGHPPTPTPLRSPPYSPAPACPPRAAARPASPSEWLPKSGFDSARGRGRRRQLSPAGGSRPNGGVLLGQLQDGA